MTWERLLDRLRTSGHPVEEIDFMEHYGPIAAARHPALGGRILRCVFGKLRIEGGTTLEVYLFPSPEDAGEFLSLVGRDPEWQGIENVVFRSAPGEVVLLSQILGDLGDA
jgi:hypothetical protein